MSLDLNSKTVPDHAKSELLSTQYGFVRGRQLEGTVTFPDACGCIRSVVLTTEAEMSKPAGTPTKQ